MDRPPIHQEWESVYLNRDLDRFYDAVFARIAQYLEPRPGETILDAGCGYGRHAVRLARHGLAVTAVDLSEAALAHARRTVAAEGLETRIAVYQANLLALPHVDAAFDHVICWGVLMHVPEIELALDELVRVLRPGGKLVILENDMRSLHVRFWDPALRAAKRLLGRSVGERRRTERGIEEWRANDQGGLLVRRTDMRWLEGRLRAEGLDLVARLGAQFTELYAHLPASSWAQRAVYRFNEARFRSGHLPRGAMGNLLIFQKPRIQPGRSARVA